MVIKNQTLEDKLEAVLDDNVNHPVFVKQKIQQKAAKNTADVSAA